MLVLVPALAPALLPGLRPSITGGRPALTTIHMGWSDPGWNWGSAVGTAHDEAMKTRSKLSTEEARSSFLFTVFAGQADLEEMKMALALKCQRARNFNYDESNWEGLMDDMGACRFEGEDGQALLCDAIRSRLAAPPNEPRGLDPLPILVASAFQALGFVERGL